MVLKDICGVGMIDDKKQDANVMDDLSYSFYQSDFVALPLLWDTRGQSAV